MIRSANALQVSEVDLLYADLSPFAESTRFGTAFLVTTLGFGICLTILVVAWALDRPVLRWPAFLLALALVWGYPLSGHQATEPNSSLLGEVADWVHLVTAMLWVGGVLTLAVVVWPLAPDLRRAAFLRFSRIAVFLIGVLVIAGTVVAIERLPELSDLWTTSYGRTLLVKIGLVLVALAWGGFHHTFVRPRLERGESPPGGGVEPARRERRRDGGAPRRSGARQRRAASRPDGRVERGAPRSPVGVPASRKPSPPDSRGAPSPIDARASFPGLVLVAISGGAGFLGLHLSRRLVADGHDVRILDLAPLDDPGLEGRVDELRGDVRLEADARRLADGADVLVHAAAALPIQESRAAIRSVNVEGAAVTFAAAAEAGVRRVVLVSSTAVYGVPERHPIHEDDPLVGVGHYGESKIEAERLCEAFARRGLETVIVRPKTFVGPERLGVFEILFDWIREGRRIPILGDGENRYQLLAVEDLVDAVVRCLDAPVAGEALNVGAARFGTVREDLEALIDHAGSGSRLRPVPARPAEVALRALELARLSPLAEWHYRTAHKDSFVSIDEGADAARLGAAPLGRRDALCDVRLVPGASQRAACGRADASRSVGPAGARRPQAPVVAAYGTSTSAPRTSPSRSLASASFACSSGTASTSVRTGTEGASARNSSPSALVRFATERTMRSPQRSS